MSEKCVLKPGTSWPYLEVLVQQCGGHTVHPAAGQTGQHLEDGNAAQGGGRVVCVPVR